MLTGTAAAGEFFKAPSILHAQVLDIVVNIIRSGGVSQVLMHGRPAAGPSIALSFFLVAVACSFAGLCYAELASMIPIAGSAYTYSYATLGEIWAWIIGWDLILEYVVSNVAVAIAFSAYTKAQLATFHINLPDQWSTPAWAAGHWTGAFFNVPGFLIVFVLTGAAGPRRSRIRRGKQRHGGDQDRRDPRVHCDRRRARQPGQLASLRALGFAGIVTGGAIVFFTYIGFDSVSTAAEEARNPQRDLPIGIIGSLIVCTVLYMVFPSCCSG